MARTEKDGLALMPVVIRKDHGQMLIKSAQHSYYAISLRPPANILRMFGTFNQHLPMILTCKIALQFLYKQAKVALNSILGWKSGMV